MVLIPCKGFRLSQVIFSSQCYKTFAKGAKSGHTGIWWHRFTKVGMVQNKLPILYKTCHLNNRRVMSELAFLSAFAIIFVTLYFLPSEIFSNSETHFVQVTFQFKTYQSFTENPVRLGYLGEVGYLGKVVLVTQAKQVAPSRLGDLGEVG